MIETAQKKLEVLEMVVKMMDRVTDETVLEITRKEKELRLQVVICH